MGLTIADGIQDFMYEATKVNLKNKKLLMLGKQYIALNLVEYYCMAERLGVKIDEAALSEDVLRNSEKSIDSVFFFRSLGFSDVHAMDISDYENADIVFDLNSSALPDNLVNQFDYILDGGTLEHVFSIGQALNHIHKMLKVGGKVYHYLPASNWINHGFYTVSPSLLNDYYMANGFAVERSDIILWNDDFELNRARHIWPQSLEECFITAVDYRVSNLLDGRFELLHHYKGSVRCIARKMEEKEPAIPIQRHWYQSNKMNLGGCLLAGLGLNIYLDGEIVIYGMGKTAERFFAALKQHNFPLCRIRGFLATTPQQKEYEGLPVLSLSDIDGVKVIIIAACDYEEEIYEGIRHLEEQGVRIIRLKQYNSLF